MIINEKGEILSFDLTPGNVDDRKCLKKMIKDIKEKVLKLFGDIGYISKSLSEKLLSDGIHLITKLMRNMKGKLLSIFDYILSTKRALIESVNNILKNQLKIYYTRHISPINFLGNLLSGLVVYCFRDKKPHIDISILTNNFIILLLF